MTIDEAKLNELLDRLVTDPDGTGHVTATPDVHLPPLAHGPSTQRTAASP